MREDYKVPNTGRKYVVEHAHFKTWEKVRTDAKLGACPDDFVQLIQLPFASGFHHLQWRPELSKISPILFY